MMAAQWQLIQDNEPLVGRTAEIGDEIGTRVIAARLVHDIMRLCFLQERRYAPYLKWLGSGFVKLRAAREIAPLLSEALSAADGTVREDSLAAVYEAVARRHNALAVTEAVDPTTGPFDVKVNAAVRPFKVLNANRFASACAEAIEDEGLKELSTVGAIDQLVEASDLVVHFTDWPRELEALYGRKLSP
jgi:hypothetical protein